MESREVARFALSHYAAAATLRGIEITGGRTVIDGPGLKLFHPEHTRSFPVAELK